MTVKEKISRELTRRAVDHKKVMVIDMQSKIIRMVERALHTEGHDYQGYVAPSEWNDICEQINKVRTLKREINFTN